MHPAALEVERDIQRALANESATELSIEANRPFGDLPPLAVNDARRIIDCLRENPRFHTLEIWGCDIHNPAVLNEFRRNGLPLCSAVTTVKLRRVNVGNEDLEILSPAFYNTSVTSLDLCLNKIQGQRGGEAIRDLVVGNNSLLELDLSGNSIGGEGGIGLGKCLSSNNHLQKLSLSNCDIGNAGLEHLVAAVAVTNNNFLTDLDLGCNDIEGAEGGRLVVLLLQRFPTLKVFCLNSNSRLGPLGAVALAPGLASETCQLEQLWLHNCDLRNDGVANLIPDGQVNRSLTYLNLASNYVQGAVGGENFIALAARCTNLDSLDLGRNTLSVEQQRRLDLLLERKRLHTEAQALGGAPASAVFQKLVEANSHVHGLSASFVILRDYIFAEQHTSRSKATERKVRARGVKRKP